MILISFIIFIFSIFYMKKQKNANNVYLVFFSIFFIYLVGVVKYTFFPIPIDGHMRQIMIEETNFLEGINLIPFKFKDWSYLLHRQIFLNILLSMPFGFGVSYVIKISRKKIFLQAILFGVIIELIQLILSVLIGFTYRYIDINDVILNFIGVIIGYFLFKVFSFIFILFAKKINVDENPILKYIHNISKQS